MASNVKNLPLSVIIAAMGGDGQALGAVLTHYRRCTYAVWQHGRLQTNTVTNIIMLMKKSKSVLKPG